MRVLHSKGFSLIELVIVIVISGILAGITTTFITQPVQGFIDLSRRATLVYSAESAMRRMQRDIRRALPNSLRVTGGGTAIEMINTVAGARYRAAPPGTDNNWLNTDSVDADFDVLGNLDEIIDTAGLRVAIYNTGDVDGSGVPVRGLNAYALANAVTNENVITPLGTAVTISDSADEDHINIAGGFDFTASSPNSRVYFVDTAISYICNGGELLRYTYSNFTSATQPNPPAGTPALMADNIGNCAFTYDAGSPLRSGLMTLDLTITDTATGESVRLLHQVHVDNVP